MLEKDGSQVDEDEILLLLKNEIFMLLETGDRWRSENDDSNTSSATTITLLNSSFGSISENTPIILHENDTSKPINIMLDNTEVLSPSSPDPPFTELAPTQLEANDLTAGSTVSNAELHSAPLGTMNLNTNEHLKHTNLPVNWEVWNSFEIPWNKMSNFVTTALENKITNDPIMQKHVIQVVVDEMRTITTHISVTACRIIAAKIIQKYPETFKDTDKTGVTIGSGDHGLVSKLIDRNNYLNRPHKRPGSFAAERPKIPKKMVKQLVNSRSGCAGNWQPQCFNPKADAQEYLQQNNLLMDELFWEKQEESFPHQRSFINNVEKPPTIDEVKKKWPTLFKKEVIWWHFTKVTGSNAKDVLHNLDQNAEHIANLANRLKQELQTNRLNDKLLSLLQFVAAHFKEDLSIFLNVFVSKPYRYLLLSACMFLIYLHPS